ncbi:MAG: glycoside hydrolase family 13 protein [Sulfolobales archaeon]
MYQIIRREEFGKNRYGRYIVRFATKCVGEGNLYLVSTFTSFFPGREIMKRLNDTCETYVKLWEGVYPYVYVDSLFNQYTDPDNPDATEIDLLGTRLKASIARVGIDDLEKALKEGGIHPQYIEHDENNPAYVARYLDKTIVRIRSLRGEVVDGYLISIGRDGSRRIFGLEKIFSDKYYDYFEAYADKDLSQYIFQLDLGNKRSFYGFNGLGSEDPIQPKIIYGYSEKQWWMGAIYYLIFPDSFYNYDPSNDPPDKVSPEAIPRPRGFLGGDLKGVTMKLDYLSRLGVEAIYLTPIHASPSYHRYDIIDYMSIDPYLGTLDDFKELVNEAHKRGIRIVLDMVPHHASPCINYVVEAFSRGSDSPYWKWFKFIIKDPGEIDDETRNLFIEFLKSGCKKLPEKLKEKKSFFEGFYRSWHMISWNHDNEEVIQFFKQYARYWLSMGVDGFRVDVAHGVPDFFLEAVFNEIKKFGDDKVFILEIMNNLDNYLLGLNSLSAMNYDLLGLIHRFFVSREIDAYGFSQYLNRLYFRLPVYVANSLYNLLSSHDTPRIYTVLNKNTRLLKILYVFLFTIYGSPSIYYGDEIGMEGGPDPDNRRAMIWDETRWNKEILDHVMKLIDLRKKYGVLRYGFTRVGAVKSDIIYVKRFFDDEEIIGLFSREIGRRRLSLRSKLLGLRGYERILEIDLSRGYALMRVRRSVPREIEFIL